MIQRPGEDEEVTVVEDVVEVTPEEEVTDLQIPEVEPAGQSKQETTTTTRRVVKKITRVRGVSDLAFLEK